MVTDLASVLRAAAMHQDDESYEAACEVLRDAEAGVREAPEAQQIEFWTRFRYNLDYVGDGEQSLRAARALVECAPSALHLAYLAASECQVKRKDGHDTFQRALALAADDETRARVLLQWIPAGHDGVTVYAAAVDAVALANAGTLEPATALEVWEAATVWIKRPENMRVHDRRAKLLAAKGYESFDAFTLDCTTRWMALAREQPHARANAVVGARIEVQVRTGALEDAISAFETWTPDVKQALANHEIGSASYDRWFEAIVDPLRANGRADDAERLAAMR